MAITSRKAGSTTCLNAFGFGPPSKAQRLKAMERAKELAKEAAGARTRAVRRGKVVEKPPQHRLIVVDMPGYGLGSQREWGEEVQKYVSRREMLRGAVVLVDAEVGLKEADRMVLQVLRDAEVRTVVVLTKVEKVMRGEGGKGRLDEVCRGVWEELRTVELGSETWVEGAEKGWESEIWATSAGDADGGGEGVGVAGARWAICRMAGLVEDKRLLKELAAAPRPAPKIVSFDQLEYVTAADARKTALLRSKSSF